jgi:hypothetical protein
MSYKRGLTIALSLLPMSCHDVLFHHISFSFMLFPVGSNLVTDFYGIIRFSRCVTYPSSFSSLNLVPRLRVPVVVLQLFSPASGYLEFF